MATHRFHAITYIGISPDYMVCGQGIQNRYINVWKEIFLERNGKMGVQKVTKSLSVIS